MKYTCFAVAAAALCFLTNGCNRTAGTPEPILHRIEAYQPPPFPDTYKDIDSDVYDFRVKNGKPVPPTLADTFVVDVCNILKHQVMILRSTPKNISEQDMTLGIQYYASHDFGAVPGYRSWAHWNFVRSLSKAEQAQLAKDLVHYIARNNVETVGD